MVLSSTNLIAGVFFFFVGSNIIAVYNHTFTLQTLQMASGGMVSPSVKQTKKPPVTGWLFVLYLPFPYLFCLRLGKKLPVLRPLPSGEPGAIIAQRKPTVLLL